MPGVGTGSGVPKRDAGSELAVGDLSCKAPVSDALSFPFQPEVGIQTSILMSESLVGVSLAETRQNAGILVKISPLGAL